MSLVSFAANVFDPQGHVLIDALPDSSLSASTRRVTRTATLDGNASIVDNGWTAADSTLTVEAYLEEAQASQVDRLIRLYPEVVCSTEQGCYMGVINLFNQTAQGRHVIQFLIQRAISLTADL